MKPKNKSNQSFKLVSSNGMQRRLQLAGWIGGIGLAVVTTISGFPGLGSGLVAAESGRKHKAACRECPPPCEQPCAPNPHVYPGHRVHSGEAMPPSHAGGYPPMPMPNDLHQSQPSIAPEGRMPILDPPSTTGPQRGADPSPNSAPQGGDNLDFDALYNDDNAAAPAPFDPPVTDTAPQATTGDNFDNVNASDFTSDFASTQSSFSAAPTLIGDFAGGGFTQFSGRIERSFTGYAIGTGSPTPTFDISPGGGFNPDLITTGAGNAFSGDGNIDQFFLAEPLPPTDAPLAPGPGFIYQDGEIVYTNNSTDTTPQDGIFADGDLWYYRYVYARELGSIPGGEGALPVPSPGISTRRIKLSENYSPEIRDRAFINYSFFNDFAGGLGDISRFVGGLERVLVKDLFSLEIRLPIAATYGSRQSLNDAEVRDMEIGNAAFIGKAALYRTNDFLWVGGLGFSIPTSDDTEITLDGFDLIEIVNETVLIQPFTSVLKRWGDWSAQAFMQLDIAANGDPVLINTDLDNPGVGQLQQVGVFNDSALMHLDFSLHCLLYQRARSENGLNSVIANTELHYTTTLQDADLVESNNFDYTGLQANFDIVSTTLGAHFVFGKENDIVITPAMVIPLSDGLDRQFDYEAVVQVNYLH